MARASFGGGTADYLEDAQGKRIAGSVSLWSAAVGGTRYTDLLVGGVAATSVTSDVYGSLPEFLGPDAILKMYADGNGGRRVVLEAHDDTLPTDAAVDAGIVRAGGPFATTSKAHLNAKVLAPALVGDGIALDTTAVQAAISAAKNFAVSLGIREVGLLFPRGIYRTGRFTVPGGVSLHGEGPGATRFVNTATDGLVFVTFTGSRSRCSDIEFDGRRSAQGAVGLATIQFSRPNALTAGPENIAGGVTLSAAVPAGATSLAVTSASPGGEAIVAGEVVTLKEGDLLAAPTGVTVTPTGTVGTTTYGYRVSARNSAGETLASATVTTTTGNATLTAANYNAISWTAVAGAASYDVYGRTSGSELRLANVSAASYNDTGAVTPAGALPTVNTTAKLELARVAESYASGLTLLLTSPTATSYTVAAKVSVATTDVGISDCRVFGNGRDGIAFWHTVNGYAERNVVRDFTDTGIDLPSAGSRFVRIIGNNIETTGRWGISVDNAETAFGRVADCLVKGNVVRFLPGGTDPEGNAIDGVYVGNVDRIDIEGNVVDLSLAGLSGVHFAGEPTGVTVRDLTVFGGSTPRANTFGIRNTSSTGALRVKIIGGTIQGVARGVELNTARTGLVSGTEISNVSDYAVNVLANSAVVQAFSVLGAMANGNVVGVRFGGTAHASSRMAITGCVLTGSSFTPTISDTAGALVQTGNVP